MQKSLTALVLGAALALGSPLFVGHATAGNRLGSTATAQGDAQSYGLSLSFTPLPDDLTQTLNIYVAAKIDDRSYLLDGSGAWLPPRPGAPLPVARRVAASGAMTVQVLSKQNLQGLGGAEIYLGYGRDDTDLLAGGKYTRAYVLPGNGGSGCSPSPLKMAPIKAEHIDHLGPLGSLVAGDHTYPTPHMYFYVKNDATPGDIEAPVYAPADLVVNGVSRRHYGQLGGRSDYTDYGITFSVCGQLQGYFIHLRSLAQPQLQQAVTANCQLAATQNPNETFCQIATNIPLKLGEEIGTTGDKLAGAGGLDMGLRDYALPSGRSAFANPERWCPAGSQGNVYGRCYAVCPLDYLPEAERSALLPRFSDSLKALFRSDEPRCGTVYQDLPGSARGYWVSPGSDPARSELAQLFLGASSLAADIGVFVTGNSIPNLPVRQYLFAPQRSGRGNRAFEQISDEQVYCYDSFYQRETDLLAQRNPLTGTILLLRLSNAGQSLSIEAQSAAACGAGPWTMSAQAATFLR